jgi:pimeloyl-[acyl-carrier protein] synthase
MADTEQQISLIETLKDPAVHADPYPKYAELRELGRLIPTIFGGHVATHHSECFAVLRDARFSSSSRHQVGYEQFKEMVGQIGLGDLFEMFDRVMLFADPPDHTRLRRLVSKAFTPRAIDDIRPRIAAIVEHQLDLAEAKGEMEIVEDLAFPLPVTVISEMIGVPIEDHLQLRRWTAEAVKLLDPNDDVMNMLPATGAVREMREYFDTLVEKRRSDLGDDLLSALIAAEDEGDRLTHDELIDTTILLFGAGHETTVNLISGGVLNLLRHPGQLARLQADPSLIASAVEELLRFGPPVQFTARTTTTDVELAGVPLAKGTDVIVMIAGANRDPELFDDPDTLDIGRKDNRHLSFGGGIHLCLGAPLARVEGQEAIGQLVRRFPSLRLVDDEVEWKSTTTIRGPARLRLTW